MSAFSDDFGKRLICAHFALRGTILKQDCADLCREITLLIGMTPRQNFTDAFDDVGENIGVTHFQSLLESYIAIDTYAPHHNSAFLQVVSCKPFDAVKVRQYLEDRRYHVVEVKSYELSV